MFPSTWVAEGLLHVGTQGESEWETFHRECGFSMDWILYDEQGFAGEES